MDSVSKDVNRCYTGDTCVYVLKSSQINRIMEGFCIHDLCEILIDDRYFSVPQDKTLKFSHNNQVYWE